MRTHFILCLSLFIIVGGVFGKQPPTLDDAYGITSVGSIASNPINDLYAFEIRGGISIRSRNLSDGTFRIEGGSKPSWSPDGQLLAFFKSLDGKRQIFVWETETDTVRPLTDLIGGIYQRGKTYGGISWAPKSDKIVFSTRLVRNYEDKTSSVERDGIRHYDAQFPINQLILEGVFSEEYRSSDLRRAIDLDPNLDLHHIVIVDVTTGDWSELEGRARQYFYPTWSPNGRYIVAIADETDDQNSPTYFGKRDNFSDLVIFDLDEQTERKLNMEVSVVLGKPDWTQDGKHLVILAQKNPPSPSFTSILVHSLESGESRFVETPRSLSAREVYWSKGGRSVVAKLYDRFVYTLWKINPFDGSQAKIDTVDYQVDSFAELAEGIFLVNAQSATFKGRLFETHEDNGFSDWVFDANPQLEELEFCEQRRITWRNKSGEEVDGIIIIPPGSDSNQPPPVIVNPYPSSALDGLDLWKGFDTGQLQAARGYAVFRPNLRTPHGVYRSSPLGKDYYEKARGVPGISIMLDDFNSGIEYLIGEGLIDPNRIGIFGHSDGGWAANFLVTETDWIKAAVIISGASNAILLASFPMPLTTRGIDQATNGNVFDDFSDYVRLSPIFRMREIDVPMLLMVGDRDWTWLPQMVAQYGLLRQEGKNVQLIRYANEGHSLSQRPSVEDALDRMHSFFDQHLRH